MDNTPTTTIRNQPNHTPLRVIFFGMTGVFSRAPLLALLGARTAPPIEVCAVVLPTLAGMSAPRLLRADERELHPPFVRLDRQVGIGVPGKPRRPPLATLPMAASPIATLTAQGKSSTMEPPTAHMMDVTPQVVAPNQNILEMAAAHHIPIFEVARLNDPRTLDALAAFSPDVICVACFSRRLPPALLRIPRLGCLNVHPSLLPSNRGPDPLFWTFHHGDATTGVSIHLTDERLDTGPIVLQETISIPEGMGEAALEAELAAVGGELLARAVVGLATGALHPRPQDDAQASAHPWPSANDFVITSAEWSAQRAYRFARGVADRGQPITLVAADGARFQLIEALAHHGGASDTSLDTKTALATDGPWRLSGDMLWARCSPGVLRARVIVDEAMEDVS